MRYFFPVLNWYYSGRGLSSPGVKGLDWPVRQDMPEMLEAVFGIIDAGTTAPADRREDRLTRGAGSRDRAAGIGGEVIRWPRRPGDAKTIFRGRDLPGISGRLRPGRKQAETARLFRHARI